MVATGNRGKLAEFSAMLGGSGVEVLPLPAGAAAPEESGVTLAENALIKAEACHQAYGGLAVADDSGLFVDALGGAPGVHSARYAGAAADDAANRELLLAELAEVPEGLRGAEFRCVLCLVDCEGEPRYFQGVVRGSIAFAERGSNGFGYDPLFVPEEGDGRTFAEMEPSEKDTISHRGRAIARLGAAIGATAGGGRVTGLDHLQMAGPPGCEQAMRAFYSGLLGLEEIAKPPPLAPRGGLWFRLGGRQLHVGIEDDFVPARKAHPALRVAGLAALREHLAAAGVKVIEDSLLEPYGVARFYADDPAGNRVEFVEDLGAPPG